jgi:mannose-6-phosphate isomerase-like protein (cupin superfamily)
MGIVKNHEAAVFDLPGLHVRGLASPRRGASETCVFRIRLAPGAPGSSHAVTREEVFVATTGRAVATVAGARHELEPGDALIVPPGVEFALANPSKEDFEAIVSFPVGGQAITADGVFTPPWAE